MREAIAIDVGGTKISWAVIDETFDLKRLRQSPTPSTEPEIIRTLERIIDEALADNTLVGAGIGIAGLVDHAAGTIVAAPNLALSGSNLIERLCARFEVPIRIDNDANLAVLGELCRGAGVGKRDFIGLTIGTGLGGGVVIDGRLWRGHKGAAAEFGHIIVDPGGPVCGCGNRGCLETKASGTAIERLAKEAVVTKPDSTLSRSVGGDPDIITGPAVALAARSGDSEALAVLREVGRWLGLGIGSLINVFDPELVVLGGGVASSLDIVVETIAAEIDRVVIDPRSQDTPLIISKLENNAGLLGAAGLIFS